MNRPTRLKPSDMAHDAPPPPVAARRPVASSVHGRELVDEYAWLRDPGYPEVTDKAILAYLRAENDYFERLYRPHRPLVDDLVSELRARMREDDESVPVRDGDWWYQWRFAAGDEYRAHYRRRVGEHTWRLVVDERELARGHEYFRLGGMDVSEESILAYSTDFDGDERYTLRFRDLARNSELDETIENTIDDPIWLPGGRTLVYLELNEAWRPYRVRLHEIGTDPTMDPVLYEEADEGFFVHVGTTQDRRYLLIETGDHETSEVRIVPADTPRATPRLIAGRRIGHRYRVDHAHGSFYILTNDRSVNFRIARAAADDPGEANWRGFVAPRDEVYLSDFTCYSGFLLIEERGGAVDHVVVHPYDGDPYRVRFPEELHTAGEGDNREFDVTAVQLRYESMITPPTVYDFDVVTRELNERKRLDIPSGYDGSRYRCDRLSAPARDGTSIPVTVVYRDDYPLDGTGFVHVNAYGAYGIGTMPHFSRNQLSLLDRGFAFAIAHVRGGDDMGYQWYLDGKLDRRRNTFNDFVDCAHHLIDQGYTSTGRLCASGGSAGGQLMGVIANEAPDLWAAVVAHVPFVDVLNTMLDPSLPLTPIEWPEWGDPARDLSAFDYLRSYSPYENVSAREYPPMLVTAGLSDPRVTYWEPAKWTARLRARRTDDNVLLLKTNMGAGHGGKTGRFQHLEEVAQEIAFFLLAAASARQT